MSLSQRLIIPQIITRKFSGKKKKKNVWWFSKRISLFPKNITNIPRHLSTGSGKPTLAKAAGSDLFRQLTHVALVEQVECLLLYT